MRLLPALAAGLAISLLSGTPGTAAPAGRPAPEIVAGGRWFNTGARGTSLAGLRGRVVLVNLWVHSCVNCQRSLPTLKRLYAAHKGRGLEILGVHTPEFESDKSATGLAAALRSEGVTWPVVQDNALATWNAYGNRYWPSFYLVDRRGLIRAVHEGELSSLYPDGIAPLEAKIKALLAENGA